MKIAIMQPYFLPSIYYWQLINYVDTFVILDDVKFMSKKFSHRNFIYYNKKKIQLTLFLKKKSQNKNINELEILSYDKLIKNLKFIYKNELNFNKIINIVEENLKLEKNLSKMLTNLLIAISSYLNLKTIFFKSSELEISKNLSGADRMIKICHHFKSKNVINLIGGKSLYDKDYFLKNGINIKFINFNNFKKEVSIIDYLMTMDKKNLIKNLNNIRLI
tara:strand:- start:346 stop:1002 length:657 start_codon:yes stop_codon:yes gene_type:complete